MSANLIIAAALLASFGGLALWWRSLTPKERARLAGGPRDRTDEVVALAADYGGTVRMPAFLRALRRAFPKAHAAHWQANGGHGGRAWTGRFAATAEYPCLILEVQVGTPDDAGLGREGFFGGRDAQVGDLDFDSLLELRGAPDWISAALGSEARRLVRRLLASGEISLAKGTLRVELPSQVSAGWGVDLDVVRQGMEDAFRLAGLLEAPARRRPGLLVTRMEEGVGVGRLAALRLLCFHPDSHSARVLAGDPVRHGAAVVAAARFVSDGAEDGVIALLDEGEDDVVAAAIELLRQRGSIDAVEGLRSVGRRHRVVAEAAVLAIQARAGDAAAGGLALDAGAVGGVALAGEAGEVAVVEGGGPAAARVRSQRRKERS